MKLVIQAPVGGEGASKKENKRYSLGQVPGITRNLSCSSRGQGLWHWISCPGGEVPEKP